MHILFVAKHNSGGNDEEQAVTWALQQLGHKVTCLQEHHGHLAPSHGADLCLFFKWNDPLTLKKLNYPKAFWYFDRVFEDDYTLMSRNRARLQWMADVVPCVDMGFCTDGDWVANDTTGKLVWLPQGFDSRKTAVVRQEGVDGGIPILFTGLDRRVGQKRYEWCEEMRKVYGDDFKHVTSRIYGEQLAGLIAKAKIVVAPDAPIGQRYWSNRVYLTLGYGGFLLHPYSQGIAEEYKHGYDLVFYHDRTDLYDKIAYYEGRSTLVDRQRVAAQGRATTLQKYTYMCRCEDLIHLVKQRCKL